MRMVDYSRFAGIDAVTLEQVADPAPGPGQVVVRVQASCTNPATVAALEGAPYVPGRDLAGTVVAVGDAVASPALGEEVLGWCRSWAAHAEPRCPPTS